MACDKDYRTNVFYTIEGKKEATIESVQRNIDIFEYYSGVNELYTEYSILVGEYFELCDNYIALSETGKKSNEYMKYLQFEIYSLLLRIKDLDDKLNQYDNIEDDILHGKTLVIYRGEVR